MNRDLNDRERRRGYQQSDGAKSGHGYRSRQETSLQDNQKSQASPVQHGGDKTHSLGPMSN